MGERTVFRGDEVDELGGEVVSELTECAGEFGPFDGARVVCIKVAEDANT